MRIILKDGSGVVTLKFLTEDVDRHGNVRIYFRRNGHKVRLRATVGTQPFSDEYRAALEASAKTKPVPGKSAVNSMRWLIAEYYRSAEFKRLDIATQAMRRPHLDAVAAKHGDNQYLLMENRHVRAIRDEIATMPHAANNRLKALRGLFKWAAGAELMQRNPARDVDKLPAPTEGHHTWTVSEILQFMEKHPAETKAGLALALLFYTGVRRSDLVKLGRQMETKDGGLRLVETKGRGRKVKVTELAIQPELRAVLDRHTSNDLAYLTTAYGQPFSTKGFGAWFKKHCKSAGLGHCSAHGLRKAGATIAADNGATTEQLMSMFGWSNPGQAHDYTRRANRKRLAAEGGKLLSLGNRK